jgi:hypothetical protein
MLSDTSSHRKQRAGPLMLLAEAAISARRLVTHALANALPVDPNSMLRELTDLREVRQQPRSSAPSKLLMLLETGHSRGGKRLR